MTGLTPNYNLFLPDDTTKMSDVTTSLNNNWAKIRALGPAKVVTSLPTTDFSYKYGDRIYHTVSQSIYLCMGSNPDWGVFWRPIHVKYGPWITCASTVLNDPATFQIGPNQTLQYKISNQNVVLLKGSVTKTSGAGSWPNYEALGVSTTLFKSVAATDGPGLSPSATKEGAITPYPISAAAVTKPTIGHFFIRLDGTSLLRVWNPDTTVNQVFFDGFTWDIRGDAGYAPV